MNDLKIYVDAGADKSATRRGSYCPCAYVATLSGDQERKRYCGLGSLSDMTAAIAHGLVAALTDLLPEDLETPPELMPKVEIISQSPGFWQRVIQTCKAENKNQTRAKTLDQEVCWKQLATLAGIFNLEAPRKPEGPLEDETLQRQISRRKELSLSAVTKVPIEASGITESWEEAEE